MKYKSSEKLNEPVLYKSHTLHREATVKFLSIMSNVQCLHIILRESVAVIIGAMVEFKCEQVIIKIHREKG